MDAKLEQKALLPCPFCGGQPTLSLVGNVRSTRKCVIKCGGCRIQRIDAALRYGHDWLKDKAITAWNTRALQAQPAEGGVGFVQAGYVRVTSEGYVHLSASVPQLRAAREAGDGAPVHVAAPKPATTTGEGVGS